MRLFKRHKNENVLEINDSPSSFDSLEKNEKVEKVKELMQDAFSKYNDNGCQCGFPRFRQIVGIDCSDTGDSYQSFETEILINLSKENFISERLEKKGENTFEIWTCKKCGSKFEFAWSDFSIAVNRQYLKPIDLKTKNIGKDKVNPIPLFAGLFGHSYPSKDLIKHVNYNTFKDYILENE